MVMDTRLNRNGFKMVETLQYIRKNRGQVAKDISLLLTVKNITEIRIIKREKEIFVYSGSV
jgi:hypothetical protein